MQRMRDNQHDTSNVHTLNLTVSAATAPAPGPSKLESSQQLGNITTEQQGPDIQVNVGSNSLSVGSSDSVLRATHMTTSEKEIFDLHIECERPASSCQGLSACTST